VLRTDGLVPGIARFQRAPDRWPCSWDRTLPACSGPMALFLGSHASSVLRTDGPVPGIARFQRAPDRWPCSWDRTLPACSGLMARFLGSHASSVLPTPSPTRNGPSRTASQIRSIVLLELYSITAPNFCSTHHRIIVIPFYFDHWSLSQFC